MEPKNWRPVVRKSYADVEKSGKRERVDTFNGNYGLNRGLAAGCLVLAFVAIAYCDTFTASVFLVFCGLHAYRAYRFGVHYGREIRSKSRSGATDIHRKPEQSADWNRRDRNFADFKTEDQLGWASGIALR